MQHIARPLRRRKQADAADPLPPPPGAEPLPPDPLLAAAALLPRLDAEASAGHAASRDAAALLRVLIAPAPAPPGPQVLADAVQRLTTLLQQQDRQAARLQAMLEALL